MSRALCWVVVAALHGCGPATTAEPPAPQPTAAEHAPRGSGSATDGVTGPGESTAPPRESSSEPAVPDAPACGPDDPCLLIGTPCGAPIAVPRSQARERYEQSERMAATVRCVAAPPVTPMEPRCEMAACREELLDEPAWRTCRRTRDCVAVPLDCRGWAAVNRASEEAASSRWRSPVECPGVLPPPPRLACAFGFCTAADRVFSP